MFVPVNYGIFILYHNQLETLSCYFNQHLVTIAKTIGQYKRNIPSIPAFSAKHTMDLLWDKFQWILPL